MKLPAKVLLTLLSVFLGVLMVLAGTNALLTVLEKQANPAPGTMVEVKGKRMHLYSTGQGSKNLVLLSGLGTPSPVLDYLHLVKELEMDFRVTVVENFGYGWSDGTDEARTNETMVLETREALQKAGIGPPYVLMVHSISGLYALHYARTYPGEIEGIIALDQTVPELGEFFGSGKSGNLLEVLRYLGLTRLLYGIQPGLAHSTGPHLTGPEAEKILMVANWGVNNATIRNELDSSGANCLELLGSTFPSHIPVIQVLAGESVRTIPLDYPGLDWEKTHRRLIEGNPESSLHILEGSHTIHWPQAEALAKLTRQFLETVP